MAQSGAAEAVCGSLSRHSSCVHAFGAIDGRDVAEPALLHVGHPPGRRVGCQPPDQGRELLSERAENPTPPQISVLDGEGNVLARWPSRSAHGSWVDAHGDIYLALTAEQRVDKYIRQG